MKYCLFLLTITFSITCFGQVKLKLSDAIISSQKNNAVLKSYRLNANIQEADIVTAGLRPNILFNQQSLFLTSQNNLNAIHPNQSLFISPYGSQLWFQVTKQYQVGGKRQAKIEVQTKEYEFAQKDVQVFAGSVAYDAGLKWLEVWYDKVNYDIVERAHKNVDSLWQINKLRYEKQVITYNEVARTQIILDQYTTMLKTSAQKYRSDLQKLKYSAGVTNDIDVDHDDVFFFRPVSEFIDSLVATAYEKRSDLQSDVAMQHVARANIQLKKAGAYPNPEIGLVVNPQNTQPYMGWYFQMPIPVFDRNQGEIQKSKVVLQQADSQIEATRMRINMEISYTWQEYQVNRENSEKYKTIMLNSDKILKSIRIAYLRGGTTILDYLLAQQNWFDTQKSYYEALYLYRKSYIDLLYVTGGLNITE